MTAEEINLALADVLTNIAEGDRDCAILDVKQLLDVLEASLELPDVEEAINIYQTRG